MFVNPYSPNASYRDYDWKNPPAPLEEEFLTCGSCDVLLRQAYSGPFETMATMMLRMQKAAPYLVRTLFLDRLPKSIEGHEYGLCDDHWDDWMYAIGRSMETVIDVERQTA